MHNEIDLFREEPVPLRDGKKKLPGNPSSRRLAYWATEGIKVGSERVFLEIVWIGGEKCTTREAFARFTRELTERKLELQ